MSVYPYYDLTVTLILRTQTPIDPIWRRFLITESASLHDLHQAIQAASGSWQDYHLYKFQAEPGWQHLGFAVAPEALEEWLEDEEPPPSGKEVKLAKALGKKPGKVIYYLYDYGDSWLHEVKLNEIVSRPYKFKRALLDGGRAFPLEDSGGSTGYEECVSVFKMMQKEAGVVASGKVAWIGDKVIERDEDLVNRRNWLGKWDPEAFDLQKAKRKFDR